MGVVSRSPHKNPPARRVPRKPPPPGAIWPRSTKETRGRVLPAGRSPNAGSMNVTLGSPRGSAELVPACAGRRESVYRVEEAPHVGQVEGMPGERSHQAHPVLEVDPRNAAVGQVVEEGGCL